MRRVRAMRGCGLGFALWVLLLAGCAGDQPAAQPSTEAVQEDSDRFFEKLRQEEQERGASHADQR